MVKRLNGEMVPKYHKVNHHVKYTQRYKTLEGVPVIMNETRARVNI